MTHLQGKSSRKGAERTRTAARAHRADSYQAVQRVEGREGAVTVYDSMTGEYLGCMGRHTWERLLAEAKRDYATARYNDVESAADIVRAEA